METSSYIALSRQGALRREMDVVAHNLANMNTGAYKGAKMMFVEHLVKSRNDTSFMPTQLAFTRDVAQYKNFAEGQIHETGDTFHMALRGDGYFVVEMDDGTQRYTRNGNFTLNAEGQLSTQNGQAVLSTGGAPIFFSPQDTNITIAGDGTISTSNGQQRPARPGQGGPLRRPAAAGIRSRRAVELRPGAAGGAAPVGGPGRAGIFQYPAGAGDQPHDRGPTRL
jgi:flagellar basal-body rod protein FlgF